MIPAWFPPRRFGHFWLACVVGLSVAAGSSPARSETCSLSSLHAGVAFPVELVDVGWACRLQPIISDYTTANKLGPVRIPLSESVYLHLLDHPPMTASLINRLGIAPYQSERRGPAPRATGVAIARGQRGSFNLFIKIARAGFITWKDRTMAASSRTLPGRPWCCSG